VPHARCATSSSENSSRLDQMSSIVKEVDGIIPHYQRLIEASPFAILATAGPEGLDCSPRGDLPGFVRVHDERTLLLPDRRGNNRVDSLRNIIRDPRVALLFLIPGSWTTLRVNGRAQLTTDAPLLQSFAIENRLPRTVLIVHVEAVYSNVRERLFDRSFRRQPRSAEIYRVRAKSWHI
jgi:PPOX class probable FMN-dependent enzyme